MKWRLQRIERKVAGLKAKLTATRELVAACERTVPGTLVCDMRDIPQRIAELETQAKQLAASNHANLSREPASVDRYQKQKGIAMKTIEQQIGELAEQIAPLEAQLEKLRYEKRRKDSRAFIAANRITKEDVEMSKSDDKPWFYHINNFVEWLKINSVKRWAEWNGQIYFQSDLKAGRMPDMPATTDDL